MNNACKQDSPAQRSGHNSAALLLIGAIIGAVLAATGLFEQAPEVSDDAVLAEVNGWAIRSSDFERFVNSLELGKSSTLGAKERKSLLDRMIEEKLILQRRLELGLVENDAAVRKAISNSMIQTITAEVSAIVPDAEDLEDFYRSNASYFARPARLRVQQLVFYKNNDSALAYRRAVAARKALEQGESLAKVQSEMSDKAVLRIPDVLLPPHKLRDYIGPKLLDIAMTLQSGRVSEPLEQRDAYLILLVQENEPQTNVPLSQVRDRVVSEYQRRAGEQALRDYLELLRAEADIRIAFRHDQAAGSAKPSDSSSP